MAAINAAGGNETYTMVVSITTLKVVGIELTSIGRIEPPSENDIVMALEDDREH